MNLFNLKHRATYTPRNGFVRKYKKNPGDQGLAVRAALQTARKLDKSMVVLKGNSYMSVVYHIADLDDDIEKYLPGVKECPALLIRPTGEIFLGEAC